MVVPITDLQTLKTYPKKATPHLDMFNKATPHFDHTWRVPLSENDHKRVITEKWIGHIFLPNLSVIATNGKKLLREWRLWKQQDFCKIFFNLAQNISICSSRANWSLMTIITKLSSSPTSWVCPLHEISFFHRRNPNSFMAT